MNRVEFLKKVRLIADEMIWLHRSNMTSDLITEMQEVFDRLEELEMREDRNDYLMKQLHIQRQINYELEYNLGNEEYLEQSLEVLRSKKAEAKKPLTDPDNPDSSGEECAAFRNYVEKEDKL